MLQADSIRSKSIDAKASKSAGERGNPLLKFLDRWFGIPLVLGLGLLRFKRKSPPPAPRRIGLLIPAAIGDTIVASPVFDALRLRFPQAELVAFASSSNLAIFPLISSVDKIVELPIKNPWEAIRILRHESQFDWFIDFGQWARLNALYSFFANAQFKVGFRTQGQSRHYIYDRSILHSSETHEVENFARLLEPFGLSCAKEPKLLIEGPPSKDRVAILHIHAGGTKPYLKEWPLENWKNVIEALVSKNYEVILTGMKESHQELETLIAALPSHSKVRNVAGIWNLREVAEALQSATVVISVNTGIMHLAAAVGAKVISLQGPTSVKRWGPVSERAIAIQSPRFCSPCLNLGFEYGCPYNNCMKEISVTMVLDAIKKDVDKKDPVKKDPAKNDVVKKPDAR